MLRSDAKEEEEEEEIDDEKEEEKTNEAETKIHARIHTINKSLIGLEKKNLLITLETELC